MCVPSDVPSPAAFLHFLQHPHRRWLPILFDGDNVKIEWRDSWKLEDYE